jgi:uncharacterized membrane protein
MALATVVRLVRAAFLPLYRTGQIKQAVLDSVTVAAVSLLIASPWLLQSFSGGGGTGWGFVVREEYNELSMLWWHLGLWLILLFGSALSVIRFNRVTLAGAVLGGTPAIVLIFISAVFGQGDPPLVWGVTAALIGAVGGISILKADSKQRDVAAGALVIISSALIAMTEMFYLIDRMNTTFKFYTTIWYALGCAAVILSQPWLAELYKELMDRGGGILKRAKAASVLSLVGIVAFTSFVGGLINIGIMVSFQRINGPRPTLDGQAYLSQAREQEYQALRWLSENVSGPANIAEAFGPSYQDYTRVSMHTGLTAVVGWDHHTKQRGLKPKELDQRIRDVKEIYTTTDPNRLAEILMKYEIHYIYVGHLERRNYGIDVRARMAGFEGLLCEVYRDSRVAIFATQLANSRRKGDPKC